MHITSTSALELARYLGGAFAIRASEADKKGQLPAEDVQLLKESGYLSIVVPQEYGGQALSLRECVATQLELARGSASTAIVAGMTVHLFGQARQAKPWPEEAFARFCRQIVEEQALFNAVASEPALGSPSRGGLPASYAAPHPDGWVVNGQKTWTTGGEHLTHMLVSVRLEDEPALVLIEQDRPGVSWRKTWSDALSLRASDSHDLILEDVVIPPENLINRGKRPGPSLPNPWFPSIMTTTYLGAAFAARDALIKFTLERIPTALGKPIATLPKIQRQVGEIDMALQAAQALLLDATGAWEDDSIDRSQRFARIVAAKQFAIDTANHVTDLALVVAGGQGISKALPLERHFRDARAGRTQPPAGDTALEIIGRAAIEEQKPDDN